MGNDTLLKRINDAVQAFEQGYWPIETDYERRMISLLMEARDELERFMPIILERQRQDAKWGEQNHADEWWHLIMGEEYGELAKALLELHFAYPGATQGHIRKELIETIAVGIAWLECMDKRRG